MSTPDRSRPGVGAVRTSRGRKIKPSEDELQRRAIAAYRQGPSPAERLNVVTPASPADVDYFDEPVIRRQPTTVRVRRRPATPTDLAVMRASTTGRRLVTIAERDGGWWCAYCGMPLGDLVTGDGIEVAECGCGCPNCPGMTLAAARGYAFAEVEHMTPRARGGGNDLGNLCLACGPCNGRKGAMTADEFRAAM